MTNSNRLFYGSCFALITTAFSFSIRAGILPQLGEAFSLSAQQLGFINFKLVVLCLKKSLIRPKLKTLWKRLVVLVTMTLRWRSLI